MFAKDFKIMPKWRNLPNLDSRWIVLERKTELYFWDERQFSQCVKKDRNTLWEGKRWRYLEFARKTEIESEKERKRERKKERWRDLEFARKTERESEKERKKERERERKKERMCTYVYFKIFYTFGDGHDWKRQVDRENASETGLNVIRVYLPTYESCVCVCIYTILGI